ncbi:MAG: undecaprenyl-diphosphate phosphatase [Planctomycetia bacterium]|nr:undecaprenyl-diphosphate phosphatase [Planctomycetia bacterium]
MSPEITMLFKTLLLAVVQGIAEFLPISSSGHLLVLGRLLELPEIFTLSILLHLGTLASVIVFFRRELLDVLLRRQRAILLVIVGSIPTGIIGVIIVKYFDFLEESLLVTGLGFFVTGLLLVTLVRRHCCTEHQLYFDMVERSIEEEEIGMELEAPKTIETTSFLDALIVGTAQGISALPGLSRSGSTISAAAGLNFDREWAAEFSFFLSIPVILGGAALEIVKLVKSYQASGEESLLAMLRSDSMTTVYLIGMLVSFFVGWISLYYLMRLLKSGRLHYFAVWLFFMGVVCLAWNFWPDIMTQLDAAGLGDLVRRMFQ